MIIRIEGPCTIIADECSVIDAEQLTPPPVYPAWYSADLHQHFHGCPTHNTPAALAALNKTKGVDIAAALVWSYGDGWDMDSLEFEGQKNHQVSTPENIMRVDLEISSHVNWPAARMGHLIGLNLTRIAYLAELAESRGTLFPIAEDMREQGATIGMAHGQTLSAYPRPGNDDPLKNGYPIYNPKPVGLVPYELPALAVLGMVDFIEVESPNGDSEVLHPGPAFTWHHLARAGYPLALVGASDFPCLNSVDGPGTMRTLIPSDCQAPEYDRALAAVKAQRGVLSRGGVGELRLEVETINRRALVTCYTDQPGPVEIFKNGKQFWTLVDFVSGEQTFDFEIEQACYLTAHTVDLHTGIKQIPFGTPQRDPASVAWLRDWIDELSAEVSIGTFGEAAKEGLPYYSRAIAELDS